MAGSCWRIGVACFCGALLVAAVATAADPTPAPGAWTLRDGDRVVLLGDTFVEREGDRGYIESALVASHPEAALTIRNLGWSGDTVWAESRGVFDQPAKGYERMLNLVGELQPTIVFVAYGRNESYKGAAGLDAFRDQLKKLCDDLRKAGVGTGPEAEKKPAVRLVLVTPHRFETADATARNAALASYSEAIRQVAAEKQAGIVDLFAQLPTTAPSATPLTENGVHLSNAGYAEAAGVFAAAAGRPLSGGFTARSENLRRQIAAKNTLFFHRWRPANETYIFLFRKHEQGNNAVEMPQFDPLVEEAERKVRSLAKGLR
jgi:lysophospholipase L1-like esterase